MVKICVDRPRLEVNTRCKPSGAHGRILIIAGVVRQSEGLARLATSMMKMLKLPILIAASPGERDPLPVRTPGRIRDVAFAGGEHLRAASVDAHEPELLVARRPEINKIWRPVLGFTLGSSSIGARCEIR